MRSELLSGIVLIRGGGDLASGVALRLHRCGLQVIVSELPQPLAVRRRVCFAEAVFCGTATVEDCTARKIADPGDTRLAEEIMNEGHIPVLVDPDGEAIGHFRPAVIVDARMLKRYQDHVPRPAKLLIGLGPGFVAGENCDAVIETNRGISLGRVVWNGSIEPNTGVPEPIAGRSKERVLRSPADGAVIAHAEIGDHLEPGKLIAEVGGLPVQAPFSGVLRGLIHPGVIVKRNMKIGDVDPRDDPRVCIQISDKSLAVAGGVLEAIFSFAGRAGVSPALLQRF
jgi:xanthine dehydrogenase accessory factor